MNNHSRPATTREDILLATVVTLFTAVLGYAAWTFMRAADVYHCVKTSELGWEQPVNAYDPQLGYLRIPARESVEFYPEGREVPVRQDGEGFRVSLDASRNIATTPVDNEPVILALGDSFTFGTGCLAEEAYPYLVANHMEGTALNAGVGGYGLAQMVLRARDLIPKHQPHYVLVQYSPWLVSRALLPVRKTVASHHIAVPYFSRDGTGALLVVPPSFSTNYFDLPVWLHATASPSLIGLGSFSWNAGFPLWMGHDLHYVPFRVKTLLGLAPEPCEDSVQLVSEVYAELASICSANNSQMVVVLLGPFGLLPKPLPDGPVNALRNIPGIYIADAYGALIERLDNSPGSSLPKAYCFWRKDTAKLIDLHPNPKAHAIVAEEIVRTIERE